MPTPEELLAPKEPPKEAPKAPPKESRKALPGRSAGDKRPVVRRGEPFKTPNTLTKWSTR